VAGTVTPGRYSRGSGSAILQVHTLLCGRGTHVVVSHCAHLSWVGLGSPRHHCCSCSSHRWQCCACQYHCCQCCCCCCYYHCQSCCYQSCFGCQFSSGYRCRPGWCHSHQNSMLLLLSPLFSTSECHWPRVQIKMVVGLGDTKRQECPGEHREAGLLQAPTQFSYKMDGQGSMRGGRTHCNFLAAAKALLCWH